MSAPRHIVDALECVISLYFSNVRHNYRAAFILCDELIEVTCREKVKQTIPALGKMAFPQLMVQPKIQLDPVNGGLGKAIDDCHRTRNDMQHNNPAATVDEHHCADAILDAARVMEHCFAGARAALPDKLKVALRVVELFSQSGDIRQRTDFSNAMRDYSWRGTSTHVRVTQTTVSPGDRQNWGLVILSEYAQVEQLLNRVTASSGL